MYQFKKITQKKNFIYPWNLKTVIKFNKIDILPLMVFLRSFSQNLRLDYAVDQLTSSTQTKNIPGSKFHEFKHTLYKNIKVYE